MVWLQVFALLLYGICLLSAHLGRTNLNTNNNKNNKNNSSNIVCTAMSRLKLKLPLRKTQASLLKQQQQQCNKIPSSSTTANSKQF